MYCSKFKTSTADSPVAMFEYNNRYYFYSCSTLVIQLQVILQNEQSVWRSIETCGAYCAQHFISTIINNAKFGFRAFFLCVFTSASSVILSLNIYKGVKLCNKDGPFLDLAALNKSYRYTPLIARNVTPWLSHPTQYTWTVSLRLFDVILQCIYLTTC